MNPLAAGISYVDLQFQGVPRVIATAVLHGTGGVALIDPGPSTTLPALTAALERAGIPLADVTALLLTHIHLDHAGAAGTLVHANPRLRVYVHEQGAPHLVDPTKLVASAARLYGDAMDRLWGEVRPVPADAIVSLGGGERIAGGGRDLEVAYTPGHASHHVSYFSREAGMAFVGDTAGIRLVAGGYETRTATAKPSSRGSIVARKRPSRERDALNCCMPSARRGSSPSTAKAARRKTLSATSVPPTRRFVAVHAR